MAKPRRDRGDGSCARRPDGRWEARGSFGVRPDGTRDRRSFYGTSRREALDNLRDAQAGHTTGQAAFDNRITVAQLLAEWLAARGDLRPTTRETYGRRVRACVLPHVGALRAARLAPGDVRRMLDALEAAGVSATNRVQSYCLLSQALAFGLAGGLLPRNVAALVRPPKVAAAEVVPLTAGELARLLAALRGHKHEALFLLMLALGLRRGEALGLRWQDVDLEGRTLAVRQQVTVLAGKPHVCAPKTGAGERALALPETVAAALRAHRARQAATRLRLADRWRDHGLVFPTDFGPRCGEPLHPSTVWVALKVVAERAGLPHQRVHDLRHNAGTQMAKAGLPVRTVMQVLGHTRAQTTMRYSHTVDRMMRDAADAMDAALDPKEEARG